MTDTQRTMTVIGPYTAQQAYKAVQRITKQGGTAHARKDEQGWWFVQSEVK